MADDTSLQKLGTAIEEFLRTTDQLAEGAFITGWVVAASTAKVQSDDQSLLPLVTGATYTIGPETSVIQAVGLAKYLEIVGEKATWQMLSDDNED